MNEQLILFTKAEAGTSPGADAFLEDLIDACVMESYFREHTASRQLSGFHDTVAPQLPGRSGDEALSGRRTCGT